MDFHRPELVQRQRVSGKKFDLFRTCAFPFITWQKVMILILILLRTTLFLYCICDRAAKCSLFLIHAIEMPALLIMTVIGSIYYQTLAHHFDCVSS